MGYMTLIEYSKSLKRSIDCWDETSVKKLCLEGFSPFYTESNSHISYASPLKHLLMQYDPSKWAIKNRMFKTMLDTLNTDQINGTDVHGTHLVSLVTRYGSDSMLQWTLERGADPNLPEKSPLDLLAGKEKFHRKKAEMLLDCGLKRSLSTECLSTAIKSGNNEFLAFFSGEAKSHSDILFHLLYMLRLDRVMRSAKALLYDCEIDPNITDNQGNTMLHYIRDENVASFFIQAGADPGIRNNEGAATWETGDKSSDMENFLRQEYHKKAEMNYSNTMPSFL